MIGVKAPEFFDTGTDAMDFNIDVISSEVTTAAKFNLTRAGRNVVNTMLGATLTNVIAEPIDGGDDDIQNEFQGLLKLDIVALGTMVNGTTNTVNLIDTTPTGEWTDSDGDVTTTADTGIKRKGANSLKIAWLSTASNGDGAGNPLSSGNQDWTDDESVGVWLRCDQTLSAGDLVLEITDSIAGAIEVNIPALAIADKWIWTEIDISVVANASKDVITDLALDINTLAGTAVSCFFDYMYKWDGADEDTLGRDVLNDGVLSILTVATASGSANTLAALVEGTDFITHYQSGNDAIITITDQSANSGIAMISHQD